MYKNFHTLRLQNKGITDLDDMKPFINCVELSLTGNKIEKVKWRDLPAGLTALHLNANRFGAVEAGDDLNVLHSNSPIFPFFQE